jgi:hypothetical protein
VKSGYIGERPAHDLREEPLTEVSQFATEFPHLHPTGMRCVTFRLENGDKVQVYSDSTRIFLRLRREVPTGLADSDFLSPSFKVAVSLTEGAALALASELLSVVASRRRTPPISSDEEPE